MITVSESQVEQIEYLIAQSLQGNHLLFDAETIRQVFDAKAAQPVSQACQRAAEHHFEQMILCSTLEDKRAYLETLKRPVYRQLVRTYFNIVKNNLASDEGLCH